MDVKRKAISQQIRSVILWMSVQGLRYDYYYYYHYYAPPP